MMGLAYCSRTGGMLDSDTCELPEDDKLHKSGMSGGWRCMADVRVRISNSV